MELHVTDGRVYDDVVGKSALESVRKTTELTSVLVWIDRKKTSIRRALLWDLLNPDFQKSTTLARMSKNGTVLVVRMAGSDGAGGYIAEWTIQRRGPTTRRILYDQEVDSGWPF